MLKLINFQDHPSNRNKKVFYFRNEIHGNYFEELLNQNNIWFEKQIDSEGDQRIYYGIKLKDFKTVKQLNYLTIGKFRNKFIADKYLRVFVIGISILIMGIAIAGAFLSQ